MKHYATKDELTEEPETTEIPAEAPATTEAPPVTPTTTRSPSPPTRPSRVRRAAQTVGPRIASCCSPTAGEPCTPSTAAAAHFFVSVLTTLSISLSVLTTRIGQFGR